MSTPLHCRLFDKPTPFVFFYVFSTDFLFLCVFFPSSCALFSVFWTWFMSICSGPAPCRRQVPALLYHYTYFWGVWDVAVCDLVPFPPGFVPQCVLCGVFHPWGGGTLGLPQDTCNCECCVLFSVFSLCLCPSVCSPVMGGPVTMNFRVTDTRSVCPTARVCLRSCVLPDGLSLLHGERQVSPGYGEGGSDGPAVPGPQEFLGRGPAFC